MLLAVIGHVLDTAVMLSGARHPAHRQSVSRGQTAFAWNYDGCYMCCKSIYFFNLLEHLVESHLSSCFSMKWNIRLVAITLQCSAYPQMFPVRIMCNLTKQWHPYLAGVLQDTHVLLLDEIHKQSLRDISGIFLFTSSAHFLLLRLSLKSSRSFSFKVIVYYQLCCMKWEVFGLHIFVTCFFAK